MTMFTAESPSAAAGPAAVDAARPGAGSAAGAARPQERSVGPAPDTAVTALEQQLSRLFATAKSLLRDRAVAVHPELSPGGYMALATLVRSGPLHAGALAAALYVDKSVVSRIIRQLTELGLAERRADPNDGRAFYIAATPATVRTIDAIRDQYRRSLHGFLAGWDPNDIAQLTALLARLNDIDQAQ
jgi:DNA-binding MarR family transcriptional regulator